MLQLDLVSFLRIQHGLEEGLLVLGREGCTLRARRFRCAARRLRHVDVRSRRCCLLVSHSLFMLSCLGICLVPSATFSPDGEGKSVRRRGEWDYAREARGRRRAPWSLIS